MLELKEEIPNERILGVSSRVFLINLMFQKLDSVEVQLNIIVMLGDGKLLCLGYLREHINFKVWANPSKHQCKNGQTVEFFFMPVARGPRVQRRLLFDRLASRISEKLEELMSQELGMHSFKDEFFAVVRQCTAGS